MKKVYNNPKTIIVLSLPDTPIMGWVLEPSGSHAEGQAPMRHVGGPTQSAGILYI